MPGFWSFSGFLHHFCVGQISHLGPKYKTLCIACEVLVVKNIKNTMGEQKTF